MKPLTWRAELVMLIGDRVLGAVGNTVGVGDGVGVVDGAGVGVACGLALGVGDGALAVGEGVGLPVGAALGVPLSVGVGVTAVTTAPGPSANAVAMGPEASSPRVRTVRAEIPSTTGRASAGMRRSRMARGGC